MSGRDEKPNFPITGSTVHYAPIITHFKGVPITYNPDEVTCSLCREQMERDGVEDCVGKGRT